MPRWHSSDWPSGTFRNTIIDLMDAIGNANAWPTIDLFDKYNPEYDAWGRGGVWQRSQPSWVD